jgi:hypothetical protein
MIAEHLITEQQFDYDNGHELTIHIRVNVKCTLNRYLRRTP